MPTIKQYVQERMKKAVGSVLVEQGARHIKDPINYLDLNQNKWYDDVSLGRLHFSKGKEFADLEYTDIQYGVCNFGLTACFFITDQGIIRYQAYGGKSHQLVKVDKVLKRSELNLKK